MTWFHLRIPQTYQTLVHPCSSCLCSSMILSSAACNTLGNSSCATSPGVSAVRNSRTYSATVSKEGSFTQLSIAIIMSVYNVGPFNNGGILNISAKPNYSHTFSASLVSSKRRFCLREGTGLALFHASSHGLPATSIRPLNRP